MDIDAHLSSREVENGKTRIFTEIVIILFLSGNINDIVITIYIYINMLQTNVI